ncbi:gliding motility-associated C-terminal domain-containing protein [Ferruginibacter sp. HRS2-29]|uniref:gliding motility-associated C-terminal domain-containing protein n=1 Tax=Ferruginibacter sp. HRS2-29 TaxID=2487334 RepID=UPI0020CE56EE|nr:gliding motility-associated C-terminal domain-containing protein [Ferruginibacter sp. HRS2-29]MCP9753245.1 hypothetical protein [Ferruginibacter sp. HRS2-29]
MHSGITKKSSLTFTLKAGGKQLLLMFITLLTGFAALAQPANDNPCSAAVLPVSTACVNTASTNVNATGTTGVPDPDCADYNGADVWFSFVVPAGGSVTINTTAGTLTDAGMEAYSGTCNALVPIECDDDDGPGLMPKLVLTGLTPGNTIWVRLWAYGGDDEGTFSICVTLPPPPPTNISPCTATEVIPGNTCSYTTYTNLNAPGFPGAPAPGCAGYSGGDVWFKVTVPCGGRLIFDTQEGDLTDGGMAIYSGTCGALTLIECSDDDSPNGGFLMPYITASNLTAGSTIWIRVWEYNNDNNGTFGLCVSIPPPPGPAGTCSTALPFCTSNVYTFPNTTNQPSIGSNGIYGCLDETPNPVWYYMQVQSPGDITIGISQVDLNGNLIDVDFALWGPFPTLNASCGGLSAANNISCSFSPDAEETAQINNAQIGEFYVMLLTNYENEPGFITFQQTGGTGTSNCDIICTLTAANSGPVCGGGTINLTASTVANATYLWTGPNCWSSTAQNPTNVPVPTAPGTYVYTVTATTPSGTSCSATTTVTVTASPALGADKSVTACAGTTVNLTTQFTTTNLTTAWTLNGVAIANPAAVNVSGIYQLIGTNAGGCKDTALVTVVIDTVNFVVASVNANCSGNGTITVSAPGGIGPFTYNINTNPGVFQAGTTFSAPQGSYTIITKDAQGCTTSKPVTVAFTNDLSIAAPQDVVICNGQSVTLTSTSTSSSATYSWSPSAGLSSATVLSPVANPTRTTLYTLTATLGSCTRTDDVLVTVNAGINVNAGPDLVLVSGDKGQLQASVDGPVSTILWSPTTGLSASNILAPEIGPLTTAGTFPYTITVRNALGCTSSDQALVTVVPYCIKVKNAFTPNGDGNNDLWQIYDDYGCLKNVTVHIFNRYGNKVYESRDYRNNWDGRYKGKSLPDATYYAVIDFTLINGKLVTIKSDVTILR